MNRKPMGAGLLDMIWPKKCSICNAREPYQTIQSIMKQIFNRLVVQAYVLLRCLDIDILC